MPDANPSTIIWIVIIVIIIVLLLAYLMSRSKAVAHSGQAQMDANSEYQEVLPGLQTVLAFTGNNFQGSVDNYSLPQFPNNVPTIPPNWGAYHSFVIPSGVYVRFYEQPNFQGANNYLWGPRAVTNADLVGIGLKNGVKSFVVNNK